MKKDYVVPDWNEKWNISVSGEADMCRTDDFNVDECIDKYTMFKIEHSGSRFRKETEFLVRRAIEENGSSTLEMRVLSDAYITPRVEINPLNLSREFNKIKSYGLVLDKKTLDKLQNQILTHWNKLQSRLKPIKLGFNLDVKGEIGSFRAGVALDTSGKFYKNEPEDNLPNIKGTVDTETLAEVMKNVKRRLIVLHGLVAPFIGLASLENENSVNPIVLITGDSSTGKTTIARYVQSLSTDPNYSTTYLTFDSTEKYLLKMLGKNQGVGVTIDDTSLGNKVDYRKLVYSLANQSGRSAIGQEYGRSGTSILLTSERDIVYSVPADYKGIHARIFSIDIKNQQDLFESSELVKRVEQSTNNNHGQVLPIIVQWMFEKSLPTVMSMVEQEEQIIAATYNEDENIITRWYRYFAYMKVVAKSLEETLGIEVDVDEAIEYLIAEIKLTLEIRSFEETRFLLGELFVELYKYSILYKDKRYVSSKDYKTVVMSRLNELKISYGEVAKRLERLGLLVRENGTIYPNINGNRHYSLKRVQALDKKYSQAPAKEKTGQ